MCRDRISPSDCKLNKTRTFSLLLGPFCWIYWLVSTFSVVWEYSNISNSGHNNWSIVRLLRTFRVWLEWRNVNKHNCLSLLCNLDTSRDCIGFQFYIIPSILHPCDANLTSQFLKLVKVSLRYQYLCKRKNKTDIFTRIERQKLNIFIFISIESQLKLPASLLLARYQFSYLE